MDSILKNTRDKIWNCVTEPQRKIIPDVKIVRNELHIIRKDDDPIIYYYDQARERFAEDKGCIDSDDDTFQEYFMDSEETYNAAKREIDAFCKDLHGITRGDENTGTVVGKSNGGNSSAKNDLHMKDLDKLKEHLEDRSFHEGAQVILLEIILPEKSDNEKSDNEKRLLIKSGVIKNDKVLASVSMDDNGNFIYHEHDGRNATFRNSESGVRGIEDPFDEYKKAHADCYDNRAKFSDTHRKLCELFDKTEKINIPLKGILIGGAVVLNVLFRYACAEGTEIEIDDVLSDDTPAATDTRPVEKGVSDLEL